MTQENVYTMQDWRRDGTLRVETGQVIEPEIYWQLLCALPPKRNDRLFQCGEPYDHDWNTGKPLYMTFESIGGNYYRYIGLQP